MSSGSAHLYGSILETAGNFLSTESEDRLAANAAEHEDLMEYRYDALDAEVAMAEADLQMKNRVAAQEGMFMGHANPATASAGGVPSLGQGFTPKPAASFPNFHPTGGLISAGNVA